jgi:amino acid adenylation domain-containing protein
VTLSSVKQALLDARLKGLQRDTPIPRRGERGGEGPLSFAQERLWFIERVSQTAGAYNVSAALRLTGALHRPALERAVAEIVRRHDVLRATFADVDGVPVQVIAPFDGFALATGDLSTFSTADREVALRRRAADFASRPFNLAVGPLMRASLLRLDDQDHALLICAHHAVSDDWSLRFFFRELSILYGAYRAGRESPLAEPVVQYADYAAWQRDRLQGERLERHIAYWTTQLAGAPAVLPLPTDHPRPAAQTFHGGQESFALAPDLLARLRDHAREEQTTLFTVLLAAVQVLLAKYTGTDDIVVGSPIAGRGRAELDGLLGLFVNMLVLRTDLSGDPTFRTMVRRVRHVTLDAYEHQDLPFERLVAELRPERVLSHSPLFQVVFMLHDGEALALEMDGLQVRRVPMALGSEKYDLSFSVIANRQGLQGIVSYSADLFRPPTIARMCEHVTRLLAQVARQPDRRLSTLILMDEAEQAQVAAVSIGVAEPVASALVHEQFQAHARRTPDAVAVVCGASALSYRALAARVDRLACRLRRAGVGPEVRVGLLVEPSLAMVAAVLGVLEAGGAYVPLDPTYPTERLAYMLADSGARVLLTDTASRAIVTVPAGVIVIDVDAAADSLDDGDDERTSSRVGLDHLAYVIYTSGSTGAPKGVAVTHAALNSYLSWAARTYPARTSLLHSSLSFDFTVTPLFLPLLCGGHVDLIADPANSLVRRLDQRGPIDLLKLTPAHLQAVGELLDAQDVRHGPACLVVGGDALLGEHVAPWRLRCPETTLVNEYGPTEATVGCAIHTQPVRDTTPGRIAIGRAVWNTQLAVLDAAGTPVPIGLPGELFIGGAQVARGYLGRPSLTADRFGPDPCAAVAGTRRYRTGDRVRWRSDGTLEYLGRIDEQVKIRGFRVEPEEVAMVLRQQPGVIDGAVIVREDVPGDKRIVAYVVGDISADLLRDGIRRCLPEYLVPAAFVVVDRIPLTANGKLDRTALPAPVGEESARVGPRNFIDVQLMQIWEELLGVEVRDPRQSFFELGGHSLLAMRLLAKIQRRFRCDRPIATLFTGATVWQMADAIQSGLPSAPPSHVLPLQASGTKPPVFFVHTANGRVLCYLNLVRHLGTDRPIWGLQDLSDDMTRPVTTIAAEYVAAIRAVRAEGPYYLAGWSFGGLIAYEMATLLERQGQSVAFLGLLDTGHPGFTRDFIRDHLDLVIGMGHELAALAGRPFSIRRAALEPLDPDDQVERTLAALHAQQIFSGDATTLRRLVEEKRQRAMSARDFVPSRFAGAITLFRATGNQWDPYFAHRTEEEQRTLDWSRVCGDVTIHFVPGTHDTVVREPHVRALAQRMREVLDELGTRVVSGGYTHGRAVHG